MLLPLLSALLGIVAFSPLNWYPLAFFWLVPLFIFFWREPKFWRLILGALIFRLIFLSGTVYYTLEPILWSLLLLLFVGLPISIWLVKKIFNRGEIFLSAQSTPTLSPSQREGETKPARQQPEPQAMAGGRGWNTVSFASPICLEIHYPGDLADYQQAGARFIVNPTSNRWIDIGTKHLFYLTGNLKKLEAVWLKLPVISSGVKDYAGLTLPNGQARLIDYQNSDKNYAIFFEAIRY